MEASFTVDETCNPFRMKVHWEALNVLVSEGFRRNNAGSSLRIVPVSIGFLLNGLGRPNEYRCVFEEFPAYSSVLLRLALLNLRTVIFTAAVYRGFDHKLRLAPNLIN